jgi:hypothetical protein
MNQLRMMSKLIKLVKSVKLVENDEPTENDDEPIIEMSNLKPIISYTTKFTTHHYNNQGDYYDSLLDGIISFDIRTKA